jgi:hypothetical protein
LPLAETLQVAKVRRNTYELVEFLHDILKVRDFPWAEFPHIASSTVRRAFAGLTVILQSG